MIRIKDPVIKKKEVDMNNEVRTRKMGMKTVLITIMIVLFVSGCGAAETPDLAAIATEGLVGT